VLVVAALGGIFTLQEQMRVRFDEPGKHGDVGPEFLYTRKLALTRWERAAVDNFEDLVAADHDGLVMQRLVALAVDEVGGVDGPEFAGRLSGHNRLRTGAELGEAGD